VNIDSKAKYNI